MKKYYTEVEVEELLKDAQKGEWGWIILGIIPGILIGMIVTLHSTGVIIEPMDVTPMKPVYLLAIVVVILIALILGRPEE